MFSIGSNQTIRIGRGEDSGIFTLPINMGSEFKPDFYKFYKPISISSSKSIKAEINAEIFKAKGLLDGDHKFIYKNANWYLNEVVVNLSDYGITVIGTALKNDYIIVSQHIYNTPELYFYLCQINDDIYDYLMKKIFTTNGKIVTIYRYNDKYTTTEHCDDIIDEHNNMKLHLNAIDTRDLDPTDYVYAVQLKHYDEQLKRYTLSTIINRNTFHVY